MNYKKILRKVIVIGLLILYFGGISTISEHGWLPSIYSLIFLTIGALLLLITMDEK